MMEKVTYILIQALEFFHILSMNSKWIVPKRHKISQAKTTQGPVEMPFHNCSETNHQVQHCTKPRDKDKIAKNIQKFKDKKAKHQSTRSSQEG